MVGGGRQRGGSSVGRSTEEEEDTEVEHTPDEGTGTEEEEEQGEPVTYTEDGKIILDMAEFSLWFKSKLVVRGVTASTQQQMTKGYTCWSQATNEDKEAWFNNFRQNFHWPQNQERLVWERYNKVASRRLRDNMYKIAKRGKAPQFMKGGAYEELIKKRASKEFKDKSAQAKLNVRRGRKDGRVEATHFGGSQSFMDRAMSSAKKNKGTPPTVPELFYETHTKEGASKGQRVFTKKKDRDLYNKFLERKDKNPDVSDNELWFDLVGGFNKGGVYWSGSAKELYYSPPAERTLSSQHTYVPGIVTQLQTTLEAERQERRAEREAREAWEAARDEDLRRMKEQMEMMTSYFQTCNPGWRPQSKDPRDPSGGGSGAGAVFPVTL